MALFGRKQEEKEDKPEAPQVLKPRPHSQADLSHILKNPRITEKATTHQEAGIYTFDVAGQATKSEIRQAVRALYGVTPLKVRVVPVPSKQKRSVRTGAQGVAHGGKKAYVYLKQGETITIT